MYLESGVFQDGTSGDLWRIEEAIVEFLKNKNWLVLLIQECGVVLNIWIDSW